MAIFADWKPRTRDDVDIWSLDLIPEEGFVLSRIDGATAAGQLPLLTGLPRERVDGILEKLVAVGALMEPQEADLATDQGAEPSPPADLVGEEGNWRRYYQQELRALPVDRRIELAHSSSGLPLRALCFDAHPKVAAAIFENPELGLEHGRLIARHHRSSLGLTALGRQTAFLSDRQVMSELFRNPQTPDSLLQRIFQRKNLQQLHGLAVGHDASERVRKASRRHLRQAFSRASADEKGHLIFKTEGRCLILLTGVSLDGKTAALLSSRPVASPLLVRNLARWPATPPPVLQHLYRQPIVKRSPDLRMQIQRHPNAPSRLGA